MALKYLKYYLFVLIVFLVPPVFAYDFDVSNQITSPVSPSGPGTYTATELNGSTNSWNINTRYSGLLTGIRYNIPAPDNSAGSNCFNINDTYTITMNMATNDWRNRFGSVSVKPYSNYSSNWSNGHVSFISKQKISFTFTIPSSVNECYQSVIVNLNSTDINTPFTGETNWNLKSVILTDPMYSSGGGGSSGGGSSGGTTTPDYSDITSNQNQNTENIINNNNQNSQNIIENNNQNAQSIIDNQNKNTESTNALLGSCHKNIFNIFDYTFSSSRYTKSDVREQNAISLVSNGDYTGGSFPLIYHLQLKPNTTYYFKKGESTAYTGGLFYYIYRGSPNGTLVTYTNTNENFSFTTPITNYVDYYLQIYIAGTQTSGGRVVLQRPMLFEGSDYTGSYIAYNEEKCTSKLDDTNNSINNLNDSINENSQNEINSQKVCKNYDYTSGITAKKVLTGSGSIGSDNNGTISDYISITPQSTIIPSSSSINFGYYCFYTSSKSLISCSSNNTISINNSLTIPTNAYYIRFTFNTNYQRPSFNVCIPGNQAMTNTLTDGNIDKGTGSDFFDDFTSDDFGLSDIITIPLTTIQSLTSKTCSPLSIPIPFTNNSVSLPCMTEIYNQFPTIYNLWKIVSFGIISYLIAIDIFHIVKGFKDPESDKVEVLDL